MIFQNILPFIQAVNESPLFDQEIKGKRVRKELNFLKEYANPAITFKRFEFNQFNINFYINVHHQNKLYSFLMQLDDEYPFSSPEIYYLNMDSPYGEHQNLLASILENNWGPSILLGNIFDKLPFLVELIQEDNVKCGYQIEKVYRELSLAASQIAIFEIDEFVWKYFIKQTLKKKIGLTNHSFLLFAIQGNGSLKLEMYQPISNIKNVEVSISGTKFKLNMQYQEEGKPKMFYMQGNEVNLEQIIFKLNPIEAMERKIRQPQAPKDKEGKSEVISIYSKLIEHYSLRDAQKTQKLIGEMQGVILKEYEVKSEEVLAQAQSHFKSNQEIQT